MAVDTLPAGSLLHGKNSYWIEKVLGQGTFGITYLASIMISGPLGQVGAKVAVKEFYSRELDRRRPDGSVVPRPSTGMSARYAESFRQEAENLSKMNHPGIVKVMDAFEANGTYFYVMEFLTGGNLDNLVKNTGMPEAEAIALIRKVGEAVSYMHEFKFMHLDIKPKNIMLVDSGKPVLIDFGISRQFDGKSDSYSPISVGTSGYAPIEQADPQSFQPTMDIYAMGATLYKMLTGVTPPLAANIFKKGFSASALESKGISEKSISAIRQAMAPHEYDRPQSVEAFLKLLPDGSSFENRVSEEDDTDKTILKVRDNGNHPGQGVRPDCRSLWRRSRWPLLAGIAFGIMSVLLVVILHRPDTGTINGHEWVDMGLSVKWATCNLGATYPSDNGSHFAWGETETKLKFTWSDLKYCEDTLGLQFSKYSLEDNKRILDIKDDPARAIWGRPWRTPTKAQFEELFDNCEWKWISLRNKKGFMVTSKKNGKSIFLPASGYRDDEKLYQDGEYGKYWSSTRDSTASDKAYYLLFWRKNDNNYQTDSYYRYFGRSIRPVTK